METLIVEVAINVIFCFVYCSALFPFHLGIHSVPTLFVSVFVREDSKLQNTKQSTQMSK